MRRFLFMLLLLAGQAAAQQVDSTGHPALLGWHTAPPETDTTFLRYLFDRQLFSDLLTETRYQRTRDPGSITPAFLHYEGMAYYFRKQLDSAARTLAGIPDYSVYGSQARLYGAFSFAYLRKTADARSTLAGWQPKDSLFQSVKNLELAGIALLDRDLNAFDAAQKQFTGSFYAISQQEANLESYRQAIVRQKNKKPWKAAVLSAVVPGLGKIYARKPGQGVASFLQCLVTGLQAYEGLRKDGPGSARFLIFGSLFSVFYAGNIWGSAFAVQIKKKEFNDRVNEQILFDLHIPLRTVFR